MKTDRCYSKAIDSELPDTEAKQFHLSHFLNISATMAIYNQ